MAKRQEPKERVELRVLAIDEEGRGVGERVLADAGKAIDFRVRGAFTGDHVVAQVERVFKGSNLVQCRVIEFLHKGSLHHKRRCAHSHPCPACPLHDLRPQEAAVLKRQRVIKALSQMGLDTGLVAPLKEQDSPDGYRQKVKLMVGGQEGGLVLGLYAPYTHNLVPADACAHVMPALNKAIQILKETLNAVAIKPHSPRAPALKALVVRAAQEGICATLVTGAPLAADAFEKVAVLVEQKILCSLAERFDPDDGNSVVGGQIIKQVGLSMIRPLEGGPLTMPDSFCQADPVQACYLYQRVAAYLREQGNQGTFIDAFAGNGGFSQALLAEGAHKVIAVEASPHCQNSLLALPIESHIGDMATQLALLPQEGLAGIVVDPPKKGLGNLALFFAALKAKRFALVSCDPQAMAKDLRVLVDAGYQIECIEPIDLFAGTPELETLVLLRQ